jgi:dolichol-phosphate hexosyltransferase
MVVVTPIGEAVLGNQTSRILVSIIIPAYNEEKNLGNVLIELRRFLELAQVDHEIIVVDDGSTDKTKEIASQNGVKILSNKTNQGKGSALKRGFECAKGEIIVTMDADGSHDPKDIQKLILPVKNGIDFAVGSRFDTEEGRETTTRVNLFGNRLLNLVILMLTGNVITDSQSGFRAYKSNVLKEIIINSKGFEIETELTLKPLLLGYSLKAVPICVRKRKDGVSRLNPVKDGLKIMKQLARSIVN